MGYEARERMKADPKLINEVERQVLELHEKAQWNIGTLKQLHQENGVDDEWRRCQRLATVRGVLKRFLTPEQLYSARAAVLGRMMAH